MTRVLYIGGTGEISHACMDESLRAGHTVTVFNRGSASLSLPAQVEHVQGDLRTRDPYRVLGDRTWDVICQFLAFEKIQSLQLMQVFGSKQLYSHSLTSHHILPPLSFFSQSLLFL